MKEAELSKIFPTLSSKKQVYFRLVVSQDWEGLPGGSDGKEPACNEGDPGFIPGLGRSPGEGNGYPLQYSALENSMESQRVGRD